jgi:RNA binding exosome subunit
LKFKYGIRRLSALDILKPTSIDAELKWNLFEGVYGDPTRLLACAQRWERSRSAEKLFDSISITVNNGVTTGGYLD